jgi:hypothetical protein
MKPDERGLPLSIDSTEAAASFDRAVGLVNHVG